MVRKIKHIIVIVSAFVLVGAFCTQAHAETYSTYDGNPSNTYIQYYRDIIGGLDLNTNYVVFRSNQNEYKMVTGELVYNNNTFTSTEECKVYTIDNGSGSYNAYSTYNVSTINNFVLNTGNKIVYSDIGDFPQLEERGARYEILTTIILCIIGVCYLCRSIFYHRPR